MSASVDRASRSTASALSTSPSPRRSADERSSSAILRTTTAAWSRGLRSGARGTTVAATSATDPPMIASVQRRKASPGAGASAATTIPCTAAWMTISCPASSSSAIDMPAATITAICHPPEPIRWVAASPRKTPSATPTVTSATRRWRWP